MYSNVSASRRMPVTQHLWRFGQLEIGINLLYTLTFQFVETAVLNLSSNIDLWAALKHNAIQQYKHERMNKSRLYYDTHKRAKHCVALGPPLITTMFVMPITIFHCTMYVLYQCEFHPSTLINLKTSSCSGVTQRFAIQVRQQKSIGRATRGSIVLVSNQTQDIEQ